MEVCTGNECLCFKTLYFSYRLIILMQNEVDKPTRLLRFVALVHLPFSFLQKLINVTCRVALSFDILNLRVFLKVPSPRVPSKKEIAFCTSV